MSNLNGLINVFKPAGLTSHDVVNKLRRILKIKKVGHTGTLDPGVTGVLPICIGKATKIAEYLTDRNKGYRGELTLGITTDTQDSFGNIVHEKEASGVTIEEIEAAFSLFRGSIQQIPPMVSAVRHKGKKLYELAREGQVVERKARSVEIFYLEIINKEGIGTKNPKISFEVLCSKGTYIRTLCEDIGEKLGVGGFMSSLVRTRSGIFTLENTVTLEYIEECVSLGQIEKFLQPIDTALQEVAFIRINSNLDKVVKNGNPIFLPGIIEKSDTFVEGELVRIYGEKDLLAIGKAVLDKTFNGDEPRFFFQPISVLV